MNSLIKISDVQKYGIDQVYPDFPGYYEAFTDGIKFESDIRIFTDSDLATMISNTSVQIGENFLVDKSKISERLTEFIKHATRIASGIGMGVVPKTRYEVMQTARLVAYSDINSKTNLGDAGTPVSKITSVLNNIKNAYVTDDRFSLKNIIAASALAIVGTAVVVYEVKNHKKKPSKSTKRRKK